MEKATRQYNSKNNIFQSTLPRRERPFTHVTHTVSILFQSTLPRRERRKYSAWQCLYLQFQSTLPRRERRIDRTLNCVRLCYFNPRSREGSDGGNSVYSYFDSNFNPRSREGSDSFQLDQLKLPYISIHAPAKGATLLPRQQKIPQVQFQSTLPRRERPTAAESLCR